MVARSGHSGPLNRRFTFGPRVYLETHGLIQIAVVDYAVFVRVGNKIKDTEPLCGQYPALSAGRSLFNGRRIDMAPRWPTQRSFRCVATGPNFLAVRRHS